MTDLRTLFRNAVATASDQRGKPALLGKTDGTLYWSSSRRDKVWARIGESGSNQEAVVQCTAVTPQIDMPVKVDMVNGVLSVVAVDEKRYLSFSGNRPGGNIGAHAWLHGRLGPDPLYLTGLQYLPLLVHPSNPAALTVTVEQGAYRWEGAYKIFETADSSSLSAYIPASALVKHFVIVCLDRANNVFVIVDGGDVPLGGDALFSGASVTVADVTAVTIAAAYLPLAAVLLYYGQTTIRAADIVMDLRQWGNEAGTTTGSLEGGVVINESGAAADFRVESDGDANMLFVDGTSNRIGFGTNTPAAKFEIVTGALSASNRAPQLRMGIGAGEYQGFYTTASNVFGMFGGADYDGTNFTARHTSFSLLTVAATDGSIRLYTNDGLTAGNTFTPTERVRLAANGRLGVNVTIPAAMASVKQASTTGAIAVADFEQADLSEEFVNFISTVGAGNPIDTAALGAYYGKARVAVNGTFKWLALYD